jgi:Yip1 domain
MTESTANLAATPAKSASFWEDVIDIFYQPSEVFRRRQGKSSWPPLLFVSIALGVIVFATFNTLQPIFDAEFTRSTAKAIAANPAAADAINKSRDLMTSVGMYTIGPITFFTMFVVGIVSWIVGKLVGSQQEFQAAIAVAAWSYMPRVIGAVASGVQGLIMDPSKLNSAFSLSIGPARFFDADTTNPLLFQLLGRFDLFTIWTTILLAIGLYVTGKVTKERAVIFGLLIWIIGALPAFQRAYVSM